MNERERERGECTESNDTDDEEKSENEVQCKSYDSSFKASKSPHKISQYTTNCDINEKSNAAHLKCEQKERNSNSRSIVY